jgi:hypothetical protein
METDTAATGAPDAQAEKEYEFNLGTLSINVFTNIPGNPGPVELTYESFVVPEGTVLNISTPGKKYPYFTNDYVYPYAELSMKPYANILNFFFSRDKFVRTMESHILATGGKTFQIKDGYERFGELTYINSSPTTRNLVKRRIAAQNITIMIRLLFPTSFPFVENNVSSFVTAIESGHVSPSTAIGRFSYLSLFGNTATVTRTVWLDDCINHPKYQTAIVEYRRLIDWCATQLAANTFVANRRKENAETAFKLLTPKVIKNNEDHMNSFMQNNAVMQRTYDDTKLIQTILKVIEELAGGAGAGDNTLSPATGENHTFVGDAFYKAVTIAQTVWSSTRDSVEFKNDEDGDRSGEDDSVAEENTRDTLHEHKFKGYLEKINLIMEVRTKLRQASIKPEMDKILTDLRRNIVDYGMITHVNKTYLSGTITPGFENDEVLYPPSLAAGAVAPAYDIIGLQRRGSYPQYAQYMRGLSELVQTFDMVDSVPNSIPNIVNSFIKEPKRESADVFNRVFADAATLMAGETRSVADSVDLATMFVGVERRLRGAADGADYEIYARVDVIGGVVTDANLGQVSCKYKDESLGAYVASRNSTDATVIVKPNVYVKL